MPAGINFALGFQRILDAQQRYVRNSLPIYLRLRNFAPVTNTMAGRLGYVASPSGANVGTTDYLITPPPAQHMVSMHNIGMSGGKLLMGARLFLVSNSFVLAMMKVMQQGGMPITDPRLLWEGQWTVGIFTDSRIFNVVDVGHEEAAGATIEWTLTCNALELK